MNAHVVRRVWLGAPAAAIIHREAGRSHDGNETGGILLGQLHSEGTAEVHRAGDPGPAAVRRPAFFLRDLNHAQHMAAEAFVEEDSVWIGEWHTHPTSAPVPSDRDLDTYARLLADPELQFHVIVSLIITAPDPHWDDLIAQAWACYPDRAEPVHMVVDSQALMRQARQIEESQRWSLGRPPDHPHEAVYAASVTGTRT